MSTKRPRFPVNRVSTPFIIGPEPPEESEPDMRRKPGSKPKYLDWRFEAAAFAHRFRRTKKRLPSAGEIAGHLQTKYDGWEPHQSDIRALLRFLIRE